MARKHIYDKDLRYTLLKCVWTDWNTKSSYRKYEVCGLENIPDDGAVILCGNHCNTLMDALVVLCSDKDRKVFGARADIFRKPLIAKIMYFLRILPMVRQRDGLRNVLQNNDTQKIIVDTLESGTKFCMFPEGSHRTMHSLQRLGKGALRIALAANDKFGSTKPVYLVPVGIEYGDYFRYHSTSLVNIGKPINVTEYLKQENFENDAQAIDILRTQLTESLSKLITYIPDNEQYEGKWTLVKMLSLYKSKRGYGDRFTKLYDCMQNNRKSAAEIETALESAPEKMSAILERAEKFNITRKKAVISIYSFRKMNLKMNASGKLLAAVAGLPYFIFSAVTTLPMWALAFKIRSGVKDKAFGNTVSFGVKLSLGMIMLLIYTTLAFCLAPWWLALILMILYMPAYSYFHDYIEGCRRWISDIRLIRNKGLYKEYKNIVKDFLHISKMEK